jgi:CheY-like chemotaxis protein
MVFGIVSRHEGRVEIDSTPGLGTTFRIRLPVQNAMPNSALDSEEKIDRSLSVLLVDDEPIARDVLARYLISDGHRVEVAFSGQEAIDRVAKESFDLLITDHAMPGMNGVQLAAHIRGIRASQPIILVTGFSDSRFNPEEKLADISLVMRKPVPRRELRRALVSVMGN